MARPKFSAVDVPHFGKKLELGGYLIDVKARAKFEGAGFRMWRL